jgi:hypothetical protein
VPTAVRNSGSVQPSELSANAEPYAAQANKTGIVCRAAQLVHQMFGGRRPERVAT